MEHVEVTEGDVFTSAENTRCPLFFSLTQSPLGVDVHPHCWAWACIYPVLASSVVQDQRGGGISSLDGTEMAQPAMVPGVSGAVDSTSMDHPTEEGSSLKLEAQSGIPTHSCGISMSGCLVEAAGIRCATPVSPRIKHIGTDSLYLTTLCP